MLNPPALNTLWRYRAAMVSLTKKILNSGAVGSVQVPECLESGDTSVSHDVETRSPELNFLSSQSVSFMVLEFQVKLMVVTLPVHS